MNEHWKTQMWRLWTSVMPHMIMNTTRLLCRLVTTALLKSSWVGWCSKITMSGMTCNWCNVIEFNPCLSDLGWDHSCDVWSVGCILLEYYLGSTLFQVSCWKVVNFLCCGFRCAFIIILLLFIYIYILTLCLISRPMTAKSTLRWWKESLVQFPQSCCRKPGKKKISKTFIYHHLFFFSDILLKWSGTK